MKDYSFYHFALTARGRKGDKGKLAEQILMIYHFQSMKMILINYQNI